MDLLEKIEERLKELDDEKAELKDFQEKDKERRCLEYAIYHRELMDVEEALHSVSIRLETCILGGADPASAPVTDRRRP
jgi:chromosome segregation ATPase